MTTATRERKASNALAQSLVLHGLVLCAVIGYGLLPGWRREEWGDPNALPGGGFAITPVSKIPLMVRQAKANPVAAETESEVKQKEPEPEKTRPKEDPRAIALKTEREKRRIADVAAEANRYRPKEPDRPNELKTTVGRTMSNPMFGVPGAGGVGIGTGTPLGTRFGAYADLIKRRIAEKWRTNDIDPNIRTANLVAVTFDILRDGSVRNIRVSQRSGIMPLDYSAQRAVQEASPFPPLPREFERDSANVEFQFQLQR
ncbi:MAG: TonB family protein [Acidobacteriaceae bacterium]|jgi:protein TonB|nr:TonB family protein [Acidobacteriaceae bacterium]